MESAAVEKQLRLPPTQPVESETCSDPMANFLYALRAPESKRQYPGRLKVFLDHLKLEGAIEEQARSFAEKAKANPQWAQDALIRFIMSQKERAGRGEISEGTIWNYYKGTKLFCEMNEIVLAWKKVRRGMPPGKKAANDRAPTLEELQRLVQYGDRRIKAIIYVMASSGVRIGFWEAAKWKHVTPLTNDKNEVVAAKVVVYPGDREEYYTFVTPEAYYALKEWMDFRASYGEKITAESWLMRDMWQTTNIKYGANLGLATCPQRLQSSAVKRIIERALWEQGLRSPLQPGIRRHPWKSAHGMRKRFKTLCEGILRPIHVEILLGHDVGVSASYYKPTEQEMLQDYVKAVGALTINDEERLKAQLLKMESNSFGRETLENSIKEKDTQIAELVDAVKLLADKVSVLEARE